MTRNPVSNTRTSQLNQPAHHFEMRFSSTPRGARLARRLSAERLDAWGVPYATDAHDTLTLLVAELAANAVRHGRVPGRDFLLRLTAHDATVRIEVTDTRGERLPAPPAGVPGPDRTGGRGLLLVECLAERWGWYPRTSGTPGKTVWAECDTPARATVADSRP
ncbi:ATP-binding protein [Streptomyces sp. CB03238]|uniref:ATP-binding protein n=1 Tax=Streptomyces sp. CB03238 TaxID=1907777 RepID=UPI000A116197|nr:ATP-binding protein [Streptomyces sp. CB03238]ORT57353.1 ATP-binding protein [Streptomyces sp. CB03238]